jgi:hypothetical protein
MRERFERPIRISLDAKARAIARFRPASGHAPSNEPPTRESNEFDAMQQRRFEPANAFHRRPEARCSRFRAALRHRKRRSLP